MNNTSELKEQISYYVTDLFKKFHTPELVYHNLAHTENVVKHCREIGTEYGLDPAFSFMSEAAAWFHDTGHLFGSSEGHEEKSNLIMSGFMQMNNIDESQIEIIEKCILATRYPYQPMSFLDEILCDADSYHFGTDDFLHTDELVKNEFVLRNRFLPANWYENTLALLENHQYFTPYCRSLFDNGKQLNIDLVRSKIQDRS